MKIAYKYICLFLFFGLIFYSIYDYYIRIYIPKTIVQNSRFKIEDIVRCTEDRNVGMITHIEYINEPDYQGLLYSVRGFYLDKEYYEYELEKGCNYR